MNSKVKKTSIVAVTVASFAIFAGSVSAQPGPGNAPGGPGGRGGGEGRPPMEAPFGQNAPNGGLPFNQEGGNNQPPFNQDGTGQQPPFANGERPHRPIVDLLQSVVEATGLTPEEIREQVAAGATIEELLTAAGTSIDAVIDQAVTDGELTEEQAQELKDRIAEGGFPNLPGIADGNRPDRPGIDLLQSVVEATGLTPEEIREQVAAGATIEDLLTAAGTSIDAVIDQAVTDGELTEEQAQALKDRIAEGDFPNLPGPLGGPGRDHFPVRAAVRGAIEATVELTGLEVAEIREQLQSGATLKDILEANGSSVDALVDVLMVEATERLATQVEEGRITQEQAAERLADLETKLTERLNEGLRPFQDDAAEATEEPADA